MPFEHTPNPEETQSARVAVLWQAVFGVSGSNGLSGSQKACAAERKTAESDMRKRIGKLEVGQARLAVIAGIGSGLAVTASTYLLKLIGG